MREASRREAGACDAIVIALPPAAALSAPAADGDGDGDGAIACWRISGGIVVNRAASLAALQASDGLSLDGHVLGLAPAADVVLHRAAFPGLTPRQAEAAARMQAAENSIVPASALHIAMGDTDDERGSRLLAVVATTAMTGWIDWAAAQGCALNSIVPAALLLPDPAGDGQAPTTLLRANIAGESILRQGDTSFVADPALIETIFGPAAVIEDVDPTLIERAIADACTAPPVELCSGGFAPRAPALIDGQLRRRLALMVLAIVLVSLLIPISLIARNWADSARINAKVEADAQQALGAPVVADQAVAQLDARLASLGGGSARVTPPLAALLRTMETAPSVAIDTLSWRGDGILTVTLGAPRPEDINPVLVALQADGYKITAQSRAGSDGRALGDITIRSGP